MSDMSSLVRFTATLVFFLSVPLPANAFAVPGETKIDSASTSLNIRSGPGTDKSVVGSLSDDDPISVQCQAWGEEIGGTQRRSPLWDKIGDGRYIADAFVAWSPSRPPVPWCGPQGPTSPSVSAQTGLNVRSGPGTEHAVIAILDPGTPIEVTCLAWGGRAENTFIWLQTGEARYLSAAFVAWSAGIPWIPWCGQAPPAVPGGGTSGFIAASAGPAQAGQRAHRVPASVTIAQSILESGWGRSTLTRDDHNYFGMKCFGSPGPVAAGCRNYATHECSGADCWATQDDFRAYRSPSDSYVDHGRQLSSMTRYAEAMTHTGDPDRFAREIQRAGYATDGGYADKLISLMRQYNLYQYDLPTP
jgi:uncharacterized protein YraI